ncbi:flippase [Chloroflexota bacterium]
MRHEILGMKSNQMNFATRALGTFGTHVLGFMLGTISSVIIARSLGPEGKGILALVMLIPTILVTLSNLGIAPSNNYHSASGKYEMSTLVGNSFVLAGVVGVLVSVVFVLFWHFSPFNFFPEVSPLYIYVILAVVPFSLLDSYLQGILLGKLKIGQVNLIAILGKLVNLLGLAVILLALNRGILSLILLTIFVRLITSLSFIVMIRRMTKYSLHFEPEVFKGTIGYGIKSHVANMSTFLHYRADQLMIGYFLGITPLGYYAVAVPIVELLFFIPRAINMVLFPEVAGSTPEKSAELATMVSRYTVLVSLLLCLVIVGTAQFIVMVLYGEQFLPSVIPLLILLPGTFFYAICNAASSYIAGTGKVIFNTYGSLGGLTANIVSNLVLIPTLGITGAALACTISYSLESIYTALVFLILSRKNFSETFIPRWCDFINVCKLIYKILWNRLQI